MSDVKVPDYEASPRQTLFHTTTTDEALYGGSAGGGKSAALVAEAVTIALEHPGINVDMFRRTIPELKGTLIPEVYKQCGAYIDAGQMTWHGQDREFRLSNGSIIRMNYLDTANDIYRYQGREMPVIMVDELTQFPQDWIEYLLTRNRATNPEWPVIFRAATNPGGVGHGWVKAQYIDIGSPERVHHEQITLPDGTEKTKTRIFIPARVDDHPDEHFRESYKTKLAGIKDESLRKALLEGDWDVFAGQVFSEWRRAIHVVDPIDIPPHWKRWMAYDPGFVNPAAVWFAQDPTNDRIFIYREFYEKNITVSDQADTFQAFEGGEKIAYRIAGKDLFSSKAEAEHSNKTYADVFRAKGFNFQPANTDRLAGKNAIHEALSIKADGKPGLQVFSSCTEFIRTVPALPYDKTRVEDVDTHAEDHIYDAARYGLMKVLSAVNKPKVYKPADMMRAKYGR